MTLKEGTLVHAVMEHDGWLHVSIPQSEKQWTMDLNGMDGYVKEDDVLLGGTPLEFKMHHRCVRVIVNKDYFE